jgi:tRNA pseudouridine55 synthase
MNPNGVVVVDKPAGMTSHDVVDQVRKIFGTRKVGHAGTLDPDATGVLVLGLGVATRLLSFAQDGAKRYLAQACFGVTTTTQDASGEVVEERPVELDEATVAVAAAGFVGEIQQIPPMVSAVKVGGERLYKKARRGEEIEREPRTVTIHRLDVTVFDPSENTADLDIICSPGTYVRTLVHDLGGKLGCGAHMSRLRRTEASGFTEADAIPLDELTPDQLRPPIEIVRGLPQMKIDTEAAALVSDGRPLSDQRSHDGQRVAIVHDGELMAVYERKGSALVAHKVLPR